MMKYLLLMFFLSLISCGERRRFHESASPNLTLQVYLMPEEAGDKGALSFRVRVIPSQTLITSMSKAIRNSMWYGVDSSFFIRSGKVIIKAAMVQPVADGVNGSFQYLVMFDDIHTQSDKDRLLFLDRYLSKRTYAVKIND